MARSVSRARKSASKSPARVKKVTTPKSEPKKKHAHKAKHSRSRSASRGPKGKAHSGKPSPKSLSRSRSRGRSGKALKPSPIKKKLSSPKPSPARAPKQVEEKKTPSVKKTPSITKTPSTTRIASTKNSEQRTSSMYSSISSSSLSSRPSRTIERRLYNTTPYESEIRQRILRHESASRSPVKVTPKKSASFMTRLYNRSCGTICAAGRSVRGCCSSACRSVVRNRREILVTILLLAIIVLISYFVLYTDPAKTRSYIHSIPAKVQEWYRKNLARRVEEIMDAVTKSGEIKTETAAPKEIEVEPAEPNLAQSVLEAAANAGAHAQAQVRR